MLLGSNIYSLYCLRIFFVLSEEYSSPPQQLGTLWTGSWSCSLSQHWGPELQKWWEGILQILHQINLYQPWSATPKDSIPRTLPRPEYVMWYALILYKIPGHAGSLDWESRGFCFWASYDRPAAFALAFVLPYFLPHCGGYQISGSHFDIQYCMKNWLQINKCHFIISFTQYSKEQWHQHL